MQRNGKRYAVVVSLALVALGALASARPARTPPSSSESEVERIQAHLLGAERILREACTSRLTAPQRASRERNLALLRDYRARGVFPRNRDYPRERKPHFVDDRGVPCAMAHLLLAAGRTDLVDRIRRTDNCARIRDLATDTELVAWLQGAGLNLAEAARIQPTYGCDPQRPIPIRDIEVSDAIASSAMSLVNGGTILWIATSPDRSTRWRGLVPAASGMLTIGLGAAQFEDGGDPRTLGIWNGVTGTVALCVGAYTIIRGDARAAPPAAENSQGSSLRVAPQWGSEPGVQLVTRW